MIDKELVLKKEKLFKKLKALITEYYDGGDIVTVRITSPFYSVIIETTVLTVDEYIHVADEYRFDEFVRFDDEPMLINMQKEQLKD